MKTKTFSILFALVMILSVSVGVFAQDPSLFDQTWDENTVLTVFNDVDMVFPDLFAAEDSDFLWVDGPGAYGSDWNHHKKDDGNLIAKAPIDLSNPVKGEPKFEYDPCGDGLIKFSVTLAKNTNSSSYGGSTPTWNVKYGPEKVTYIRDITATVSDGSSSYKASLKKCNGPDNCHKLIWKSDDTAKLSGYLYAPVVMTGGNYNVKLNITWSNYMTALWDVPTDTVEVNGVAKATKKDYCQSSLTNAAMAKGMDPIRAKYDPNTGEARFQVTIRNFAQEKNRAFGWNKDTGNKQNYVIPADVLIPIGKDSKLNDAEKFSRYTDYTCKYTVYNNGNAAPRTDYCKFGEGIALGTNAVIRFDVTIDHLDTVDVLKYYDGGDIPFMFRVGGMEQFVGAPSSSSSSLIYSVYKAVDFPCPVVSRMQVMDPLHDFLFFKDMISDSPIKPSGYYGTYEGGLWGMYQKCGKYAYMAVRLKNDGLKDELVNLKNVAVAVNGGTPMSWHWILATRDSWDNKILLETGEDVILIGRAKVTDIPSQLNADIAMTGAVNFLDYGFYITGKVFSDHNNTNCVAAPK